MRLPNPRTYFRLSGQFYYVENEWGSFVAMSKLWFSFVGIWRRSMNDNEAIIDCSLRFASYFMPSKYLKDLVKIFIKDLKNISKIYNWNITINDENKTSINIEMETFDPKWGNSDCI